MSVGFVSTQIVAQSIVLEWLHIHTHISVGNCLEIFRYEELSKKKVVSVHFETLAYVGGALLALGC